MALIDSKRWRELEPLLDEGFELAPEERARWLNEMRTRDPEIAAEIASLLDHDDAAERSGFLERPMNVTLAGLELGGWTLERPLGYGGMGCCSHVRWDWRIGSCIDLIVQGAFVLPKTPRIVL